MTYIGIPYCGMGILQGLGLGFGGLYGDYTGLQDLEYVPNDEKSNGRDT